MADTELADWVAEQRAKAKAYDTLTEALRAHLGDCDARRQAVRRMAVQEALEAAEDAHKQDLRRAADTLESRDNPQA